MKYIRTEDKIITDSIATHKLTEDICDAGYLKTLKKGANVRISKEWFNYYGRWVDIIDEDGCHYSIRPSEVEKVTKELHQANTIEDLCDRFIVEYENGSFTIFNDFSYLERHYHYYPQDYHQVAGRYGAIYIKGRGLIYVAKLNDKGKLELL